jgi:hypothetical protein
MPGRRTSPSVVDMRKEAPETHRAVCGESLDKEEVLKPLSLGSLS